MVNQDLQDDERFGELPERTGADIWVEPTDPELADLQCEGLEDDHGDYQSLLLRTSEGEDMFVSLFVTEDGVGHLWFRPVTEREIESFDLTPVGE